MEAVENLGRPEDGVAASDPQISDSILEEQFSSGVEFEVDHSDLNLGVKDPKGLTNSSSRVASSQFQKWGVRGNVTHLQHGNYQGQPATLIGFKFRFQHGQGSSRFSRAEIRVTFKPNTKEPVAESGGPIVKHFAPCLLRSVVTPTEISSGKAIEPFVAVSAGPAPVQAGVGVAFTHEKYYVKDYRTEIFGEAWTSDEDREEDDMAIWTITENSVQGEGVPREIHTAVLVQCNMDSFQGRVKVKCRTSSGLSLFGWPWSKTTPLAFEKETTIGSSIDVSDFSDMEDDHWRKFVRFPGAISSIRVMDDSDEVVYQPKA